MSQTADPLDLPPEVMEAFIASATTALQELMQMEVVSVETPLQTECASECRLVVASMHLQRTVPGKLTLLMSTDTAEQLARRYLPAGAQLSDDLINDVAGEFANVIAGQAKTMLKNTPYHFHLSLPVVSRSDKFESQAGSMATLSFESGKMQLLVRF